MLSPLAISILTGLFIYFRILDYYKSIPRKSVPAAVAVAVWTYASIENPIYIIVGLVLLNLFGAKHEDLRDSLS